MTVSSNILAQKKRWDTLFPDLVVNDYSVTIENFNLHMLYTSGRKGHGKKAACPFDDIPEDKLFNEFAHLLPDYHSLANLYPVVQYHFVLPHKRHLSMKENTSLLLDLEQMLHYSNATGLTVFHNTPEGGASLPEHEHYQAFPFKLSVSEQDYLAHYNNTNISTMKHYPGANLVLQGNDKCTTAVRIIEKNPSFQEHNIVIQDNTLILIPRKRARSEIVDRRMAAVEMMGLIPWLKEEDAIASTQIVRAKELYKGYAEVLFSKEKTTNLLANLY